MPYTFDNQIERAFNDGSRYVIDNNTVTYGSWVPTGLGTQARREFIISGNGIFISERSGIDSPSHTITLIETGVDLPSSVTFYQYTVVPPYIDGVDYVASNDPIPDLDVDDFTVAVGGYYLVFDDPGVGAPPYPKAVTQTQPTDSIIIYSTEGGSTESDQDISQAGNDIVLDVPGANPTVNGTGVFDVDVTNNITYLGSGVWDIVGVNVTDVNPLPTSNGGLFTVDSDNNLIYQWDTVAPPDPPIGDVNLAPPILKIPTTAKSKTIKNTNVISSLRRFLGLKNKIIL